MLSGVVAAAKQEGWKVNLIEAFDQPWKRLLEGTVGGYWGLFGDRRRAAEIPFRPGGVECARMAGRWPGSACSRRFSCFFRPGSAPALAAGPRRGRAIWRLAGIALATGLVFGLGRHPPHMEGVEQGDRLRALGLFALALAVPLATAFAIAHGDRIASLALALDTGNWRGKNLSLRGR